MVSSSSVTQVPGSQVKAERTCRRTPWVRAYSTERMAGLGHPVAVISSISSKEMRSILRASGTSRGSLVKTPETSVYSSHTSAPSASASATAVVSEPPRPRKVTSSLGRHALGATDHRDLARLEGLAHPLGPHLEDLGVGVGRCR